MTPKLLSAVAIVMTISGRGCSAAGDPAQMAAKSALEEVPDRSGGARLPSEVELVVVQAGDQLFVMIKNDVPGTAAISPIVSLYSSIRNISIQISPLPPDATTNLSLRGFVMPDSSGDAVVQLLPNKMYGSTYSLSKLAGDMRLPTGCYTFKVKYDGPAGVKNLETALARSERANICL